MKKIVFVFALIFCLLPFAAIAQNQPVQQKTQVAKSYIFSEELIDIPIQPFVVEKISDADLVNINPKALEAYEAAVNVENQKDILTVPAKAIKAWLEVTKITDNNPFLQNAGKRLEEWRKCLELFNGYLENANRIKTLMASSLVSAEQKTGLLTKHLEDFGLYFGVQEVFGFVKNTPDFERSLKNQNFQAKIKEIKQKRCEKNSGKDCFECGRDYAASDYDKFVLFKKACDLKYKPGCVETYKIEILLEAEKERAAAEEKRKAEEMFATKIYDLKEEVFDVIEPFPHAGVNGPVIMNASQDIFKKFEAAAEREKEPKNIKVPGSMSVMWKEIAEIKENNPFQTFAEKRSAEWRECAEKMEKHETRLMKLKNDLADASIAPEQKITLVLQHLKEFGVMFGSDEIKKMPMTKETSGKIIKNPDFKAAVKEILTARCEKNSGKDCFEIAKYFAKDKEEKMKLLDKACGLKYQKGCDEKGKK